MLINIGSGLFDSNPLPEKCEYTVDSILKNNLQRDFNEIEFN